MSVHRIFITAVTVALVSVIFLTAASMMTIPQSSARQMVALNNVRDYVAASSTTDFYYAVDGGTLYAGGPTKWVRLPTPADIIISAVAIDVHSPDRLYIGAANDSALYRSTNGGQNWQRYALTNGRENQSIGSITDIAVDSFQKLVYVGTDTGHVLRLRDTGSILVLGSHLLLDEPVLEIAADSNGSGMAFVRTPNHLYRASKYGMKWTMVENLGGIPTDIAIGNIAPVSIYVGTANTGIRRSYDGLTWMSLGMAARAGSAPMPHIDALAVDPLQPDLLYVATSQGNVAESKIANRQNALAQVDLYQQQADTWTPLTTEIDAPITDMMPVSGQAGAVYALTAKSRRLTPIRDMPMLITEDVTVEGIISRKEPQWAWATVFAWAIASMAVIAFTFAIAIDLRQRRRRGACDSPILSPVRLLRG